MAEHFPKSTETATGWCKQCNRNTEHRVDGGRLGPCIDPKHPQRKTVQVCATCLGTGKVTYSHGYQNSELGEEPCPDCCPQRDLF